MGQEGRELLHGLRSFERGKLVSARDTVQLIQDAIGNALAAIDYALLVGVLAHEAG